AVVFNRTAGFRSLAPHRRSSPAVSATHANRAVFSRLEKPLRAARLAPAGEKIRAPASGTDGICSCLFDRSAVRGWPVRQTAVLPSSECRVALADRNHSVCLVSENASTLRQFLCGREFIALE